MTATLDRGHAVPLYHQLFLLLRDEIVSGARLAGSSVPTERELADCHAVSRITARRALDELAQHGLVERKRRTGTRIIYRMPTRPIEADVEQAVESLLAFGRDTAVRVLELDEQIADPTVAARLGLGSAERVVRAVRLRLIDGEPIGEVVSYVPAALNLALRREDLTATPMLGLLRAAGLAIGGGSQTISATIADPSLAQLLAIDARAPVLQIERIVTDGSGLPLLFTRARYRADRYRIGIDLHAHARPVGAGD